MFLRKIKVTQEKKTRSEKEITNDKKS